MNINMDLPQCFKSFLIKNPLVLLLTQTEINFKKQQLAEKLQTFIIIKLKKHKVY